MLNPLLLWFLPLALVPILLHLITLYRVRTVELSTFRFLMDSYMHQRRRLRLLEWLLMAMRTAFIILIILLLSRPMVAGLGQMFGDDSGRDVVIVVDASATMGLRRDGTTAMERARLTARHIAELLHEDDHVTLVRAGHQPEVLRRGFASQIDAVLREVERLEPDVTVADLPAALAEVAAAPRHGPRVVYLLTDAQRRSLQPLGDHPALRELRDENNRLVVMNFGPQEPVENLAIVGEPPHALRPVVGLPVLLQATVAASGYPQPVDTRLSVVIEDEVVSQMNLTLEPGQRLTRQFVVTPQEPGVLRGRFELPADAFPDDNSYLFALNVEPAIRVLLVTPTAVSREHDPRPYLDAALRAPQRLADEFASAERQISAALEIRHVHEDDLTPLHLDRADVVLAADVLIDERRGEMLHAFVSAGGGLMLLPGPRADVQDYNAHLLGSTLHERRAIVYRGAVGDPDDEATFAAVEGVDLSHPILTAFADGDFFSTVQLYRRFPIAVAEPVGGYPRVLMHGEDGTPLLIEHRLGAGRLLVSGFAATPAWTDLPLKPEFVPIMLRSVAHLRRPADSATLAAIRPHEPAPVQLSTRFAGASVELIDPDERPHTIRLHQTDRRLIGAAERTGRKGYYSFRVNPPAGVDGAEGHELGFAVNLDLEDAVFETLDREDVTDLFHPLDVTYLRTSPEDPVLAQQLDHQREMWRTLIWLTFILIAAEFMLSTLRGGDSTDRPTGPRTLRQRITHRLDRTLGLARESR